METARVGDKYMKKRKDKKYRIKLTSYAKGGVTSTVMFIISVVILIVAIFISFRQKGQSGIWIGGMPFLSFVISLAGFGVGIKSFNDEGKFLKYSYIGTISNAAVWLIIIGIYLAFI